MITIKKSPTADTRTCDFTKVSKIQLLNSSVQHIEDVKKGINFFIERLQNAALDHDFTKINSIDQFHSDFVTGFKNHEWWDMHKETERHHIDSSEGRRDDINLIDVLEHITDCIMAGRARAGELKPLKLDNEVLQKAFQNTIELLNKNVKVEE